MALLTMNAGVYVTVRAKGAEFPRYMWYSSLLNQKEISCGPYYSETKPLSSIVLLR